jgi:hypothetical protein
MKNKTEHDKTEKEVIRIEAWRSGIISPCGAMGLEIESRQGR